MTDAVADGSTRMVALLAVSLLVHAALVVSLGKLPRARPVTSQQPLQIAVVEKPPPPPAAPVKVARAPRATATDVPPPRLTTRPPPRAAPPPPSREAQEQKAQPIVLPGITLESTSQASSVAVPTGNTLHGQPSTTAKDPQEAKPYKADRYVAASQVNELPGVESRPESLRPFYPEAARRRGVEGDVVLRLLIDADGSLAKVEVIRDPGAGLGEAGARAIRQFRFRPGKADGRPVATTITYVLHFVLD